MTNVLEYRGRIQTLREGKKTYVFREAVEVNNWLQSVPELRVGEEKMDCKLKKMQNRIYLYLAFFATLPGLFDPKARLPSWSERISLCQTKNVQNLSYLYFIKPRESELKPMKRMT